MASRREPGIYEGTRIPDPIPTVLQLDERLRERGDILQINFGPNHPSTHGVLRLIVDLSGEEVVGLSAVIGYLHTGFEKSMEQKTWWKAITYPERIDYVGFQNNELVFVLAIEKLLALEVPREGDLDADAALRAEPHPLAPRLPRHGRARAGCDLDVLVLLPRARPDPRPRRDGLRDAHAHALLPDRRARRGHPASASIRRRASSSSGCRRRSTTTRRSSTNNEIWLERTRGIGLLSADDAIALGQSGPVLRASGVDWDLRKAEPYLAYDQVDFGVPGVSERRRVRPLQGARRRDARVDAHRRAVPRPARADAGRAVDRGRPQGRAAAAPRAAHVDGVADPPLQDRHRGLPRSRGRGVRRDRVAARRVRVLRRVRRRRRSRGA